MLARVKHWKTTAAGVVIGGVVYTLFTSFGCRLPTDWSAWVAATLPAILGALSKE